VFSAVNKKNTHVETLLIFSLWQLLQNSFALTQFNIAILAGIVIFLPHPNPPQGIGEGVRNLQKI
jgi:multisubunit Na+/H+ antiporter MnhE subunit